MNTKSIPPSRSPVPPVPLVAGIALAVAATALNLHAQQSSWQITSGQWGIGANWSSGTAPNAQDAHAVFDNTITPQGNRTIDLRNGAILNISATIGLLTVEGLGGTTTTTFNSGTLTFDSTDPGGAMFRVQDTNNVTVNSVISLGSRLSLTADLGSASGFANNFTIGANSASGAILGNGHALDIVAGNPAGTITLNGLVSGAGTRLTKSGAGTLVLTNTNNSFDGGLAVNVGTARVTIAGAGNALVLGAAQAGANHLGAGSISVANNGSLIDVRSGAAGQFVELRSGTLSLLADTVGAPEFRLTEINSTSHAGFAFRMAGGELSGLGGTGTGAGTLYLDRADFDYSAGAITGAPNLTFDTIATVNAINNITITLNGAAMDGYLGNVQKLGVNNLTFADTGVFRATDFVVASASGTVVLGAATLDIANGLTFAGTNAAAWTSATAVPVAQTVFGADNQLTGGVNVGGSVISNLMLNGHDQTLGQITLDDGARLGLWFDTAAPSTLTIGTLAVTAAAPAVPAPLGRDMLNIYNWTGNPVSHLADGTIAANGSQVIATGGVDLDKVWFRGYAPGAVDLGGGVLAPADFLNTTWNSPATNGGGNWFDFANWSLDIPNGAGSTVTTGSRNAGLNLQGNTATIGHLVANSNIIGSYAAIANGTLIFDSGVMSGGTKAPSTISGTNSEGFDATVQLNNDLIVSNSGWLSLTGTLLGSNNIAGQGGLYYTGDFSAFTGTTFVFTTLVIGSGTRDLGAVVMQQDSIIYAGTPGIANGSATLTSPLFIEGDLTLRGIQVTDTRDTVLTGTRAIIYANSGFGENYSFSGAGALVMTSLMVSGFSVASGNNTFSGGFAVTIVPNNNGAAAPFDVLLHSDLVTGSLAPGHNYLGSGDITISGGGVNGFVTVHADGHDVAMLGNYNAYGSGIRFSDTTATGTVTVSGSVLVSKNASMIASGMTLTITDATQWTTGTAANDYAGLTSDSDLIINGTSAGPGLLNLTLTPAAAATQVVSSTRAGGIFFNIGTLTKQGGGVTLLSSTIGLTTLTMQAGQVQIGGDRYIQPRTGATPPSLTMQGGQLQANGGTNAFNTLAVTGNSSLRLLDHSALVFNGIGTWATATTAATYQLNLSNDSGLWSTAVAPAAYDTYVYFTATTGFNAGAAALRLGLISFTGYETGAELVQVSGSNLWFLAPTGTQLSEWAGAKDTGADTDRLWSNAANWVNGVPDLPGRIAAVRDVDGLLDGNTLVVDGAFTLGALLLESTNSQDFAIAGAAGGLLIFDTGAGGGDARLTNRGLHTATLGADLRLDSDLLLANSSANALTLAGDITGSGGIRVAGSGTIILGAADIATASAYTGGFHLFGSTAISDGSAYRSNGRSILIAGNGSLFGSGSYNDTDAAGSIQSLTIGDGTDGRWHWVQPAADATMHTVNGSVRIAGNWNYASSMATSATLAFQSDDPGYLASGTWTLRAGSNVFHWLALDMDLQGESDSVLRIGDYAMVRLLGDNTFGGGVILNGNRSLLALGSDTALGAGAVTINNAGYSRLFALNGARTLANTFIFNGDNQGLEFYDGDFILDHHGESVLNGAAYWQITTGNTVTIPAHHVLTGTGGINVNADAGTETGTLVLLGSNAYTGNTTMTLRTGIAVGNDRALGSGTLVFANTAPLSSHGGDRVIRNDMAFNAGVNATLAGVDGVLTLDPVTMTQGGAVSLTVTGTAVLGQNISFTGDNPLTKNGAGLLVITSGNSDYSGQTTVNNSGTLRVDAAGDITLGAADPGHNYLGAGALTLGGGATLELVSGGAAVRLGGNITLGNPAYINITDTPGAVRGDITTYFDAPGAQTFAGSNQGLFTPGDIVKTSSGTLNWTSANITPGADKRFVVESGLLNWTGGRLNTSTLALTGGTLAVNAAHAATAAGSVSSLQSIVLDGGVLAVGGAFNFTAANAVLSLAGGAGSAIDFVTGTGLITFKSIDGENWTGALDILNWDSAFSTGNGASQLRFSTDVTQALSTGQLALIQFYSPNAGTNYAQGARLARNVLNYYELLPLGASTEWLGGAVSANWTVRSNWGGGTPPDGAGSYATFGNRDGGLSGKTVRVDTGVTLGGFVFNNTTGAAFTIAGSLPVTIDGAGAGSVFNMTGNGSVDINVNLILKNDLEVRQTGGGTLAITGVITDGAGGTASAIIKTGAGALALTAQNTYGGGTELAGGVIELDASTAGAVDAVTLGPLGTGTLAVTAGAAAALRFTATGAGAQTLNNRVTTGAGATLTLDTAAGNRATLGAPVTGAGGLAKAGSGTLTLTGTQLYTGATDLFEGMLMLTAANALTNSGSVTVDGTLETGGHDQTLHALGGAAGGAILLSDGNTLTVAGGAGGAATTYDGLITGDGNVALAGGASLTLSASQAHTGSTAVAAGGTLTLGAADALASGAAARVDGALASGTSQTLNHLTGTGTVDLFAGMLTLRNETAGEFAGRVTGGGDLLKTGTGALTLSGSNTHTGPTRVAGGELVLGNGGATGSIPAMTDTTKNVTIDAGASLVFNRGDTVTISGSNLAGGGTVAQRGGGLLVFDGPDAQGQWTGGSVVESGTMKVAHTAGVSGTITIKNGGAFVFGENTEDGSYANNMTLGQAVAGGGVLAIDISEESAAAGAPATITFGNGMVQAAAYGADFHGAVEMRNTTYRVDPTSLAFLNSGASLLRTAAGSLGSIAGTGGTVRRIDGGVDFAGGTFEWAFDNLNNPQAILSSGAISISATTQFRLKLQQTVNANTSGAQTLVSLFNTEVAGADSLLLAQSDTPITGAMNWENLRYTTDNGTNWRPLTGTLRQDVVQDSGEVTRAEFNWTVVPVAGAYANELRVSYALAGLAVFKDAMLEVALTASDTGNSFATPFTDYFYDDHPSDGAAYEAKEGSGSVLFTDVTGTTGILLVAANSHTGTTAISGSTTLMLGHDEALGDAARHTVLVSATAAGAVLDLNGRAASVGGVHVAGGARLDLHDGALDIIGNAAGLAGVTATAAGGGAISGNNALTGTGALNLGLGLLTVHGANANLHGTGGIDAATGVVLDDAAGLGDGAWAVSGSLKFAGATGTNMNSITGAGIVAATAGADVVLGGTNTTFSGTWAIEADSRLKATAAASLGAGTVDDSGTLTLGGAENWTLKTENSITGAGALVKEDANTVTLSHSNSHTGGNVITGGTLIAQNVAALGAGALSVQSAAAARFDNFSGTVANAIAGGGTVFIGAGAAMELSAANAIAAWVVEGSWTVRSQDNLGDGAVDLDGGNLTVTNTAWHFINALSGSGALTVDLTDGGTFSFAASATAAGAAVFNGKVDLQNGFFQLDATAAGVAAGTGAGAGVMKDATLVLGAGGTTLLDSGTRSLGGLVFEGGLLMIEMKDATRPAGALTVGDLRATAGSKIALDHWDKVGGTMPDGTDFFFQDSGTLFQSLVTATGAVYQAGAQLDIYDFDGNLVSDASRKQILGGAGVSGTATYDYGALVKDEGGNRGLFLAYMLRELSADGGASVTVSNIGTQDATNALTAKLTGDGGFVFGGTGLYCVGNDTSDYGGASVITAGGTLMLYAHNGLGHTSRIALEAGAGLDLYYFTQTTGALDVAAGGTLDFGGGTLVITGGDGGDGGVADGALTGEGRLVAQGGTFTVHGANAGLRASGTIGAGAAIVIDDLLGLGTGGVTAGGLLEFAGASGTSAIAIDGAGTVAATGGADIVLGGTSTDFSGTWAIAADSRLKATGSVSLGSGAVTVAGTLILGAPGSADFPVGGSADWTLAPAAHITGAGALVKEDANTVTISHSNSYTGGSDITAGTLIAQNAAALGTGTVSVGSVGSVRFAGFTGTLGNDITGAGLAAIGVGAGVTAITIAGDNTAFTGTWAIAGDASGTMRSQQNLGVAGVTAVSIAPGGDLALLLGGTDFDFAQPLTGGGTLRVQNTGTFNFAAATGIAFAGNVVLENNRFALDAGNTAALADATLTVGAGNFTAVGSGTQHIGGLAFAGGTIAFALDATGVAAEGIISTGTLTYGGGADGTRIMVDTGSFNTVLPLLQQDERRQIQLVASTALDGVAGRVADGHLVDTTGAQLTDSSTRAIVQAGATTAMGAYDFGATVSATGLYLAYELQTLELLVGRTTVLDNDTTFVSGGAELRALVTGSGGLQISATGAITLSGTASTYTGTTTVAGGTLVLGADNALGRTARLAITSTAAARLDGRAQTVGSLMLNGELGRKGGLDLAGGTLTITGSDGDSVSDGVLTGGGALVVQGGVLTVSGSNPLTASTTLHPAATVIMNDVAGLGASAAIAADGALVFTTAATGTNRNAISGAGLVSATNAANVVLAGANTGFTGTWAIAADSRLKATAAASLGTGAVAVAGTLTLGAPTFQSADWTLAPATHITGTGLLVKEDANTVTISHSNSHTGGSVITAGTLIAQNAAALGTGTISVGSDGSVGSVRFAGFTGTLGNDITGAGLAAIGGSAGVTAITIAGDNTAFTGSWAIAADADGTMRSQQNLGATGATGASVDIAGGGALALLGMGGGGMGGSGSYTFDHALTGAGALLVSTTGAFAFGVTTGTAFTGTVTLQNNTFALDTANAAPLTNATLDIGAGNKTTVATGTQHTGNLTLTGGTIAFALDATGTAAAGIVSTNTLAPAGQTVVMIDTGSFNTALELLRQDERRDIQLVSATALAAGGMQFSGAGLIDAHGGQLTNATQHDITRGSVTTASGTYDFAATASGSGLHLHYSLVALELLAGQTTVLDHETSFITDGDELHALVSGSGHLQISASTAIFLNNANNTYTGETHVVGGALITGNSGALGATSLLTISATAAVDLRATAQTVGALTTAAGGTLDLNGGALTITGTGGNSTISGALTGAGALFVQSNTLTIDNANPALAANTTIAAGATADIRHASALGDTGSITADGRLILDIQSSALSPSAFQPFSPFLSGSGVFVKAGDGAVAIVTANPGFTGSARVEGGRLLLEDLMALNAAGIDVDSGATLEYRNVTGALANTVNGTGTLAITNSGSFAIAHDNTIADTVLENATVYLGATRALGPDTATVRAGAASQLWLALDGAHLGHVTLNGALLGFAQSESGILPLAFKTATVETLTAGAGGGALVFNANFTNLAGLKAPGEAADHLTVTAASAGVFTVHVNTLGGPPAGDEAAIPLITDAAGVAVYQLDVGKLEFGLDEFKLASGSDAAGESTLPLDPGRWYLYSTGLSQAADAIIDTAALLGQDWHYALDALHLRMGDLRAEWLRGTGLQPAGLRAPAAPSISNSRDVSKGPATGNVWMRSRAYRLNAVNPLSGRGVEQYAWGVSAGGDRIFETENGVSLLGAFVDMGHISRDFGRASTGETGSVAVGFYGTLLRHDGWYADLVLNAARHKHRLDVSTVAGHPVRGLYHGESLGASLELGRRLERADGWWLEPAAQVAVAWLGGADYRTTPASVAIDVRVDDATSAHYRGQMRFGRRIEGAKWSPYGKFGVVRTTTDGGAVHARARDYEPDLDGWRVEFGFGASYQLNDRGQLYLDYEYGKAPAYERPWSLTLGYRRPW
jgi:autotransporter-associated beta strand protein